MILKNGNKCNCTNSLSINFKAQNQTPQPGSNGKLKMDNEKLRPSLSLCKTGVSIADRLGGLSSTAGS
jgi:hypothetical protein